MDLGQRRVNRRFPIDPCLQPGPGRPEKFSRSLAQNPVILNHRFWTAVSCGPPGQPFHVVQWFL